MAGMIREGGLTGGAGIQHAFPPSLEPGKEGVPEMICLFLSERRSMLYQPNRQGRSCPGGVGLGMVQKCSVFTIILSIPESKE